MYREHSVAVVIPAYNEESFVRDVIDSVPDYVDRVYVVDDHSADDTWAEIRRTVRARAAETEESIDDDTSETIGETDRHGGGDASQRAYDARSQTAPDTQTIPDSQTAPDSRTAQSSEGSTRYTAGDPSRQRSTGSTTTRSDGGELAGNASADAAGEPSIESEPMSELGVSGDSDITVESTESLESSGESTRPSVVGIRHDRNRGVGATITTGYRRALRDGIDVTAVMAGDGQMDPAHLDRLLDPIVEGRAEYAKGNRLSGRSLRGPMSRFRLFGNAVLSVLTKIASGYWRMLDPQNGYTAISHRALRELDLDALYDKYGFANDVLIALNERELTIADVAMPAVYGDEESHIDYRSFVPTISKLLLDRFVRRLGVRYLVRDCHPLVGLYATGAAGLLGVAAMLLRFGSRCRGSADHDSRAERRLLIGLTTLSALLTATTATLLAMAYDREANDDLVVVDE